MIWEKLPLVEVVWTDAAMDAAHDGDLDRPDTAQKFGGLKLCSDVGYLIRKGRKVVVLAVGICRDDQTYRHSNSIPRGWVREIVVLSRPSNTEKEPTATKNSASDGAPSTG